MVLPTTLPSNDFTLGGDVVGAAVRGLPRVRLPSEHAELPPAAAVARIRLPERANSPGDPFVGPGPDLARDRIANLESRGRAGLVLRALGADEVRVVDRARLERLTFFEPHHVRHGAREPTHVDPFERARGELGDVRVHINDGPLAPSLVVWVQRGPPVERDLHLVADLVAMGRGRDIVLSRPYLRCRHGYGFRAAGLCRNASSKTVENARWKYF